jgi:hypothetical protein
MNWDEKIEKVQKVVDICIKADAHAFVLIIIGAVMVWHGASEDGKMIVGAGLAIFKGRS